jgi:hypothetical protein
MGRERPRHGAAVQRLQDRRLDLDEAVVVEVAADRRDPRVRVMNTCASSSLAIRSSSRRRKRVSTSSGRGACRAAVAATSPAARRRRRAATARRAASRRPRRRPRSGRRGRGREQPIDRLGAELVDARLELDPPGAVHEVKERHPALAAARREPSGDAMRGPRLLAGAEPAWAARTRRSARRPRKRYGNGSTPAARSASSLRRRRRARPTLPRRRGWSAHVGDPPRSRRYLDRRLSILVILSLRSPRGVHRDLSPRLRPSSALPTGDSLESLFSAGLASAEPTIVYFAALPVLVLDVHDEPTVTMSVESRRRRSPWRSAASPRRPRSAPRASPARSWRRRTRRSRRCRRTRAPP